MVTDLIQTGIINISELQQLLAILEPIARAIKCLEGLQVTVGDIWKFYVTITTVLHDLFTNDNTLSIPQEVRDEVSTIINTQYDQMIHGPSRDLFLSGLFLDPSNQLVPTPSPLAAVSSTGVTNQDLHDSMQSYSKVGTILSQVLAKELQVRRESLPPTFTRYSSAAAVMSAFKFQFEVYTHQYLPFSVRSDRWFKVIHYWRALAESPEAAILTFVAIKIFSILGNSMPEERTVSHFTWSDTTDCASQDARTIVQQMKIYQHNQREACKANNGANNSCPPLLNWWSVSKLWTSLKAPTLVTTVDVEELRVSFTPETEDGLSVLNTNNNEDSDDDPPNHFLQPMTLRAQRDGVDITLPFFRDLLLDTPAQGANTLRGLPEWSGTGETNTEAAREAPGKAVWDGEAENMVF
ncbi:hypothetical protein B0H10DRAFT_2227168 [Mycena sp. CBHHK59/15]|nr:hypothetical protein B0H10DRAFT_2227168 [Mycena sp. CBHHK59/15]